VLRFQPREPFKSIGYRICLRRPPQMTRQPSGDALAAGYWRQREAMTEQAVKELEPQWFEEGENIRVADAFVVDITLNANG
jgi:hypothetical protein